MRPGKRKESDLTDTQRSVEGTPSFPKVPMMGFLNNKVCHGWRGAGVRTPAETEVKCSPLDCSQCVFQTGFLQAF